MIAARNVPAEGAGADDGALGAHPMVTTHTVIQARFIGIQQNWKVDRVESGLARRSSASRIDYRRKPDSMSDMTMRDMIRIDRPNNNERRILGVTSIALVAMAAACGSDKPTGPTTDFSDPERAEFVTSDIQNFWKAYDDGGAAGGTAPFQTDYLDRASPGLVDFVRSRNVTAASLAAMVRTYPRYFADIRASTLRLANDGTVQGRMREGYRKMKGMYSAAVFPPVTFLIGRFSTGGTTSSSGMLVGLEFYSIGPSTPLEELAQFQRDNVRPLDSLPVIVAHEHTHILQARAGGIFSRSKKNLLEQTMLEGSADFIGYLVTGSNINARLADYAIPREAPLWAEFKAAMHGSDISRWLYNQGSATEDRPGDLGYFIGYRIAEAFYARTADKRLALRAIIDMSNADQFLTQSGYAP